VLSRTSPQTALVFLVQEEASAAPNFWWQVLFEISNGAPGQAQLIGGEQ
jgi:hypothetical protein